MYWNEKVIDSLDLQELQDELNKINKLKEHYIKILINNLLFYNNLIN